MGMIIVQMADVKVSQNQQDVLVTHALGSCLGITAYDAFAHVGGLFHVMLPTSKIYNPGDDAFPNPLKFIDSGWPEFIRQLIQCGAYKQRLLIKVAGGAARLGANRNFYNIGERNVIMLRKIMWQNGMIIRGEAVGGNESRSIYLNMATGSTYIRSNGTKVEI